MTSRERDSFERAIVSRALNIRALGLKGPPGRGRVLICHKAWVAAEEVFSRFRPTFYAGKILQNGGIASPEFLNSEKCWKYLAGAFLNVQLSNVI
ncbi:hypothetical protein CDAR_91431 [Caerostris darwini]|uniref:Uncharacterized protein n=1 Tax=Caerostris darwini TaxID=1538125 RepID=A0AAV4WDU3_9ARAC|nr:hypothetical protein CDAR_91431 [Caerostris darwini]